MMEKVEDDNKQRVNSNKLPSLSLKRRHQAKIWSEKTGGQSKNTKMIWDNEIINKHI